MLMDKQKDVTFPNTSQYKIKYKNMTNTCTKTVKEPLHSDCHNTVNSPTLLIAGHRCLFMWSFISLEKFRTSAGCFLSLSDLVLLSAHKMTKPVTKDAASYK